MENTAKIYIMGAAAVLVSGRSLEDWKKVEKYSPEALKIVNEEGEIVFTIKTGEGGGSVTDEGICWGNYTGVDGNATVTTPLDDDITDKKAAVMDIMGSAILDLMDLEKELPDLLEKIGEKEKEIEAQIVMI